MALLADVIAAADPTQLSIRNRFKPPAARASRSAPTISAAASCRRVVYGARLSLAIGFGVVMLNAVFGTLLGALAGYFRAARQPR